ncbi:metal ABC transporter solute-binding protein, Zn/Mn family [Microbacterium sp. CFBP9034]|uniref:metal ABC transporter solute-binding protein, Zn/Mn family n=1 Tax=Microbacterium sp. CFBP9034 TaxID=3096540 RepID=UPI002A69B71E|nr:zinc ABC transporter substrate-binding protein [Microbacterium sp. CFBP9034]MDY0908154.1 zinc ABC transporter substrate-binding protein [Microbacterium sp. CFBP9034]
MTSARRTSTLLGLAAASALALAGCAGTPAAGEDDSRISVVASTNVYGQIVEEIGGDLVDVTAIITNDTQDPHSFEASARDQLTVAEADLIVENGGGYDGFVDALIEANGSEAPVVTAVEFSHEWPENAGHDAEAEGEADAEHDEHGDHGHVEGFNEHVWYDPHTVVHVAEAVAAELGELSPDDAAAFTANAEAFAAEIEGLEGSLADIAAAHAGAQVFLTEPVPFYLIAAAELENVTPDAFSEAVEEGQDVPPATLLESLALLEDGDVRVVITNTQTAGVETAQIVGEADGRGIPSIAFSETLPEGQTYISWMQANIEALSGALSA